VNPTASDTNRVPKTLKAPETGMKEAISPLSHVNPRNIMRGESSSQADYDSIDKNTNCNIRK
jgi:hypothetical protein